MNFGARKKAAQSLNALLGTADPVEQHARVQHLAQMAQAPAVTLVISHDPRRERATRVSSPDGLTTAQALALLEAARQELLANERAAAQAAPVAPAPEEAR